jgi:hypothetical protein
VKMPYFHVLAGSGFSFLQFGHLAIKVTNIIFFFQEYLFIQYFKLSSIFLFCSFYNIAL